MYTMQLAPDADGYNSTDGTDWLQSKSDGGPSKFRLDKLNSTKMVNVTWTLNRSQYQYWRSFYAVVGSRTFLCPLLSEDGNGPVNHQCNIIPGSVSLPSTRGLTYVQQCQLEVRPLARNPTLDIAVIAAFEQSAGNPDAWYAALERLTNVTMPSSLGSHA